MVPPIFWLVPIFAFLNVLATVFLCYSYHRPYMQAGEVFPAISELGMHPPAKYIYQIGFFITGSLLTLMMYNFTGVFAPLFPKEALPLVLEVSRTGMLAGIGAAIQGLYTMEPRISYRSLIHWGGAMVFAYYTMNHVQTIQQLHKVEENHCALTERLAYISSLRETLLTKGISTVMFGMFAIIIFGQYFGFTGGVEAPAKENENSDTAQANQKQAPTKEEVDKVFESANQQQTQGAPTQPPLTPAQMRQKNAMGLMQWGIILLQALMFSTYAIDFHVALTEFNTT